MGAAIRALREDKNLSGKDGIPMPLDQAADRGGDESGVGRLSGQFESKGYHRDQKSES